MKGMLELEKISGLTSEQAKEYLLRSVEEDVKHDTAKLIKDLGGESERGSREKKPRLCGDSDSALCCGSCG